MIIKRKPFSELWPNACSCVGFTIIMCFWASDIVYCIYSPCVPLGCNLLAPWLIKIFSLHQLRFAAINMSKQQPKSMLTAVKDFQKWMEPYLAAFWGSFKVLSLQVHSQDIQRTELHYKAFSTCSRPWKTKDAGCLCAFSMLLSLFTGTSYSPRVSIRVYICCSRTIFVLWFLLHIK